MRTMSRHDTSHYVSHRSPVAAAATPSAMGRRRSSALDVTAFDPPSQVNETAPYTYHRRNSSYSSDAGGTSNASMDATPTLARAATPKTTTAAPAVAAAADSPVTRTSPSVRRASPPPTPSGAAVGHGSVAQPFSALSSSPRSLPLSSPYSNMSWLSAATPSSCCRATHLEEDHEDDGAAHMQRHRQQRGISVDVVDPWAPLTIQPPASSSTSHPHHPTPPLSLALSLRHDEALFPQAGDAGLPLSVASESVNALEAQFGAALQQLEACQRMNRKLEAHNANLEQELARLSTEVARMHRVYQQTVRPSLTQLKEDMSGLVAFLQLALRDYHHGLGQTEAAVGQLLLHASRQMTAGVPVSSEKVYTAGAAMAASSVSRASVRRSPTGTPTMGSYDPGAWISNLSMYAKGTPPTSTSALSASVARENEDAANESLADEEQEEDDADAMMLRLLDAAPARSAGTTSAVAPTVMLQRSVRHGSDASRDGGSPRRVEENTSDLDAPTVRSQETADRGDENDLVPRVVSLAEYRALELKYAATQRQLLLAEGKHRVMRHDTETRIAELHHVHQMQLRTLEREVAALRARHGETGSAHREHVEDQHQATPQWRSPSPQLRRPSPDGRPLAPTSSSSTAVDVVPAPERCYEYSHSNSVVDACGVPRSRVKQGCGYATRKDREGFYNDEDGESALRDDEEKERVVTSYTSTSTDWTQSQVPRHGGNRNAKPSSALSQPTTAARTTAAQRSLQQADRTQTEAWKRRQPYRSSGTNSATQPEGLNESSMSVTSTTSSHERERAYTRQQADRRVPRVDEAHHGHTASRSRQVEDVLGSSGASRVAQGLWAEQLLARRRRGKQLYNY